MIKNNLLKIVVGGVIVVSLSIAGINGTYAMDTEKKALPIITETVVYDNENGIAGYFARPKRGGPYPGLILIHEWWGLNDNIRENAEAFAKLGYTALAVDLYNGKSAQTPGEARKLAGGVSENLPAENPFPEGKRL